jgi:transcriptional regulator with XRE-family HTH domain
VRIRRGRSLWALGYAVRISPPVLSRIERGLVAPTPAQRRRLAQALGVETRGLLEDVEAPAQPWAREEEAHAR